MKPSDVLRGHVKCSNEGHVECVECEGAYPWPCPAVDQARQLLSAQERVAALEKALDGAADWLEAEAEYPRPDPRPAMRLQAKAARAALAVQAGEPGGEG
jgi:hypothetical protein